jgi:molybdopterin biosynthesis enzyme
MWADPLPGGSATLSNVVFADGLVRVDASLPGLSQGDPVDVLLY